jgi:Ca2+-binding RTX toxin-like protein
MYGVTEGASPRLVSFEAQAPLSFTSDRAITGLAAGDVVLGVDVSPRDGGLYLLTRAAGNVGKLWSLDPTTGKATLINSLSADPADFTNPYTALPAGAVGVDFNPVNNRLRVTSIDDKHMRVNPADARVITDADVNPATVGITGVAYTGNDNDPATGTTLYAYDWANDDYGHLNPPNNGTWNLVTASPGIVSGVSASVALDVAPSGGMWATHYISGPNAQQLFGVDPSTGQHTLVGSLPALLSGMTAAHVNLFAMDSAAITAGESAGSARVTIVRLNPRGSANVQVTMSPGTATAGSDYTVDGGSVAFQPGEVARTVSVELTKDTADEPDETLDLTLSLTAGEDAGLLERTKTTVTIADDDLAHTVPEPPAPTPPAPDRDSDGIADSTDNCPNVSNADQADGDTDGLGTVCDPVEPASLAAGRCANLRQGTPGDDSITGTIAGDSLSGFAGADALFGSGGDDCLSGGNGDDWLSGGEGADTIDTGKGVNVVRGGPGNDVVKARNRKRDTIDCGTGRDTVTADKRDRLRGCEKRKR